MEDSVKISIITVCYNSEKTIKRTIESIFNQTFKNYEYIIIDGASSDDTISIIKEYESKFDGRLKLYSEADKGIYDAMNKGIKNAKGELIGILNSDDYYEPNVVEIMLNEYVKAKKEGIKEIILYGMQRLVTEGKELGIEFYNHEFLGKVMINHPTCFVSKSVYDKYGAFDINYKSAADFDFLLRIKKEATTKFQPIYSVITNFNTGGMSSTGIGEKETIDIRYKYGLISKKRAFYEKILCNIKRLYRKLNKKKE